MTASPTSKTVTVLTAAKITELTTKFPGLGEDTFVLERDYNQAENGRIARADQIDRLTRERDEARQDCLNFKLHGNIAGRPAVETSAPPMATIAAICHEISGTCAHILNSSGGPCTIENCSAVRGYLGSPVEPTPAQLPCTLTRGCWLELGHDGHCD